MSKNANRWALGAIIAGIAGYLAGILTAPKSGKETRSDIKKAAETGMVEAEKQLKRLHTQMNTIISQAKDKVGELKGGAQKDLQGAIDTASKAKEKARDLLSSLHEGTADDKDLKRAIEDANKAIDHLRSYLQK